jgi:hypothetical protein
VVASHSPDAILGTWRYLFFAVSAIRTRGIGLLSVLSFRPRLTPDELALGYVIGNPDILLA